MTDNDDYGYENPDLDNSTDDNNEDDKKKKGIIISAIILVIALIIALIFLFINREPEEELPPAEETTTSSTTSSSTPDAPDMDVTDTPAPGTTSQSPDQGDDIPEDTDRDPEPRYKPEPATPLPTTPNKEYAEAHGTPFDPRSGLPKEVSRQAVADMFSLTVSGTDSSFEDNFYKSMEGRMSPTMEATGFKPWWPADGPEHSLGFRGMMNSMTPSRIYAFPEFKGESRVANDIIRFHYTVPQTIQSPQGRTNISSFEVVVDMIGDEDGTWLVNDYYFPEGRVPSIH